MYVCIQNCNEKLTKLQTTHTSPYDDHDDLEEIEICWSQRFSVLLEAVTYKAYELVAHCVVAVTFGLGSLKHRTTDNKVEDSQIRSVR